MQTRSKQWAQWLRKTMHKPTHTPKPPFPPRRRPTRLLPPLPHSHSLHHHFYPHTPSLPHRQPPPSSPPQGTPLEYILKRSPQRSPTRCGIHQGIRESPGDAPGYQGVQTGTPQMTPVGRGEGGGTRLQRDTLGHHAPNGTPRGGHPKDSPRDFTRDPVRGSQGCPTGPHSCRTSRQRGMPPQLPQGIPRMPPRVPWGEQQCS
jgi:hypothetical protein